MADATLTSSWGPIQAIVVNGPGNPRDFVGLYEVDAANDQWLDWAYLANGRQRPIPQKGVAGGTVTLQMPTKDGYYEWRLMTPGATAGSYIELASGPVFSIGCPDA